MLTSNERNDIKKKGSQLRNWMIKNAYSLHRETIKEGRQLIRDISILSASIVGFVIPALLTQTDLPIIKGNLVIAICLFFLNIGFGVFILFTVIKKDLGQIPIILDKKLQETTGWIKQLVNAENSENINKVIDEVKKNESDGNKQSSKELIDYIYFGLFYLALGILMLAIIIPHTVK